MRAAQESGTLGSKEDHPEPRETRTHTALCSILVKCSFSPSWPEKNSEEAQLPD